MSAGIHTPFLELDELIRMTDDADVPFFKAELGGVGYLIGAFKGVQDNKYAYAQLQAALESYTRTVSDFVSVLPTENLAHSDERHIALGRNAIGILDNDLDCVRALFQQQEKQNKRNILAQIPHRPKMKKEIEECKRRMERSQRNFRDAVANVVMKDVARASGNGWQIAGAKPLPPHALGRMRALRSVRLDSDGGDEEMVRAEVDGTDRVVQLFRGRRGKETFRNALDFLQTHSHPTLEKGNVDEHFTEGTYTDHLHSTIWRFRLDITALDIGFVPFTSRPSRMRNMPFDMPFSSPFSSPFSMPFNRGPWGREFRPAGAEYSGPQIREVD
ncbi:hypothetical protein FRB99_003666 [Tulasnella sp. 403]|nr:hypothetical protein FRB99_003666 [Tulasnella sp. 403]